METHPNYCPRIFIELLRILRNISVMKNWYAADIESLYLPNGILRPHVYSSLHIPLAGLEQCNGTLFQN
jgi:hypothetical protein